MLSLRHFGTAFSSGHAPEGDELAAKEDGVACGAVNTERSRSLCQQAMRRTVVGLTNEYIACSRGV